MSEAAEKLKPLIDALTADERAELAEYLSTLGNGSDGDEEEDTTPEELDAEQVDEINRRVAAIEADPSTLISHEEVMRGFKEKYG